MNLNLRVNNEPVDLWQTPTHISYMCMVTDDEDFDDRHRGELTGRKARAAIRRYFAWVTSLSDGQYETTEQADERRRECRDHIAEVRKKIEQARECEVEVCIV